MKIVTRITLTDDKGEKYFGEGPCRLLRAVRETGSLRAAALSMEMAYTKALRLLKNAEAALGFPLTERTKGGVSGDGSRLTAAGEDYLRRFEGYRAACAAAAEVLYPQWMFSSAGSAVLPLTSALIASAPDSRACGTVPSPPGEALPAPVLPEAAEKPDKSDKSEKQEKAEKPILSEAPEKPEKPKIGCVIMASGLGRRFGGNKPTALLAGRSLLSYVLQATEVFADCRTVVTRSNETAALAHACGVNTLQHSLPGKNDTVRLGLAAIGDADGCFFCPADQPFLRPETVQALLQAAAAAPEMIHRPAADGKPGAPVYFPRRFFGELMTLPEDEGGSAVIRRHPEDVRLLSADPAELWDIDTREDLAEAEVLLRSAF